MEERIKNLEIKFAHQDDLIDQLNKIVTRQQLAIEKMEKEIMEFKLSQNENSAQTRTLADDVPPHY